jgi:ABC-type transport system involved in multi-copper enzyme maturation permease subunit
MIGLIAKKDFLINLISVRFVIGFVLCLVIIPFTMIVGLDDYNNQMRMYQIDRDAAEKEMKELLVYSALRPTVVKQPEVLSIFSKGISANMGNKTKVSLQEYPLFLDGHTTSRDNPLLNVFFSLDFATVIAILISLLALVFAYDAITREREDGTMKLSMTGQVSRISFLVGKLAGLLLTLLPILIFCYLIAALIVALNPAVSLTPSDWAGLSLLFLTSIIYMLVFIVLGLFISALSAHSSSSIILSLLSWIVFLFLIPGMAAYLSKSISKTPLYDNVQVSIDEHYKEYWSQYWPVVMEKVQESGASELNLWNYSMDNDGFAVLSGGKREIAQALRLTNSWSEPYRINMAEKIWVMQKDYLDKLQQQQRVQQYLSWLSPSELFTQATDALCRTDANAFFQYMESQRDYRQTIIRFFTDNKIFESFRYFTPQPEEAFPTEQEVKDYYDKGGSRNRSESIENWSYKREDYYLNTDNVPRYEYRMSASGETFNAAMGRLAALLAVSILLLLGTIAVFMKYDVR